MSDATSPKAAFALRMHEVCGLLDIPEGHGRQAALGRRLKVTPKAARKWLTGASYPELETAITIAGLAGVSVIWLLQGAGPKFVTQTDDRARLVGEAVAGTPTDERTRILTYLRAEMIMHKGWFARETEVRYLDAIDTLATQRKETPGGGIDPPHDPPLRAVS